MSRELLIPPMAKYLYKCDNSNALKSGKSLFVLFFFFFLLFFFFFFQLDENIPILSHIIHGLKKMTHRLEIHQNTKINFLYRNNRSFTEKTFVIQVLPWLDQLNTRCLKMIFLKKKKNYSISIIKIFTIFSWIFFFSWIERIKRDFKFDVKSYYIYKKINYSQKIVQIYYPYNGESNSIFSCTHWILLYPKFEEFRQQFHSIVDEIFIRFSRIVHEKSMYSWWQRRRFFMITWRNFEYMKS